MRLALFLAGWIFVVLAFAGAFMPVLPTTPFLILAAACFARSSPRLERWLLEHPRFGPLLRQWRERGAIPPAAKYLALAGCCVGFVSFWLGRDPGPLPLLGVGALMACALLYVFTRPSA